MNSKRILSFTFLAGAIACAASLFAAVPTNTPDVRLETKLDQAILDASGNGTAIIKISLLADPLQTDAHRPPIDLAIVLDRSGSMSGPKLEMARRAAIQAFDSLQRGDRVTIVAYDSTVDIVLPMTRVELVENPADLINRIQSRGNTAIYEGVSLAADQFKQGRSDRAFAVRRILLLSDGMANVGPSQPSDFKRLGYALDREGIAVSTIGLGLDYNEDLMASLASSSQGNVYFVENARDLPRVFQAELGETSKLVVRDATIDIDCLDGFRPIRIIGREGRIQGSTISVDISQVYAGREKYVLVEVANPGGKPNTQRIIANVRARIQGFDTQEPYNLDATCQTRFSDAPQEVAASVNIEVQREVVYNRIALAKDEAVELADQGRAAEAAKVLLVLNQSITTSNLAWNDADIAAENFKLKEQGETIERDGVDKGTRKSMRSSSYQTRQQQYAK